MRWENVLEISFQKILQQDGIKKRQIITPFCYGVSPVESKECDQNSYSLVRPIHQQMQSVHGRVKRSGAWLLRME
jgi:hypothetical protein